MLHYLLVGGCAPMLHYLLVGGCAPMLHYLLVGGYATSPEFQNVVFNYYSAPRGRHLVDVILALEALHKVPRIEINLTS